jgi:hypothetical protein
MAVCGRCGTQHDGSSVFCPACGAVQTPAGPPAPPEPQPGQQPQQYGQPDQYGQYGQAPQAGGWGAPAWGTPPPPPPPPGGWTSQAPAQPGSWDGQRQYEQGQYEQGQYEQGQYDHGQYASAPVGPPPGRPRDPKLLLLVLGVVGIVVVAGVIAFLLLSRHGGSDTTAAPATTSSAAPSTAGPAPSRSATATPSGGVRSVTGTPEAQPSTTSGSQLSLAAAGADCTYPPGVDGKNQPVTYEPQKAVDGDPSTAWRCPGAGGHTIELHGTGLASDLGLIPGYAKVDPATGVNRFTDNHTVTQVIWRLRQGTTTVQIVQDIPDPTPSMAWIHLPGNYSYDDITVTVTGTGNPTSRQDSTPISSIAVWGYSSTPEN